MCQSTKAPSLIAVGEQEGVGQFRLIFHHLLLYTKIRKLHTYGIYYFNETSMRARTSSLLPCVEFAPLHVSHTGMRVSCN